MKTIGLLGGMSWESSLVYYRVINQEVRARCGELHSARCIMDSVNFSEIAALQRAGDWETLTAILARSARNLRLAGAEFLVICTNTMHCIGEEVSRLSELPLLHIADATAVAVTSQRIKKVGLLGTKFTMEKDFYKQRLCDRFDLEVIVPSAADRQFVHDVIFNELCRGVVNPASRREYQRIVEELSHQGAEGVILGCTEIPLLLAASDALVPLFDTTLIHATAAVKAAFGELPHVIPDAVPAVHTDRYRIMLEY